MSKALGQPLGYVKLCRYEDILINADVNSLTLFFSPKENTSLASQLD